MKHTISILVENHAGVLSRISGLFARRGYNIHSLAVGVTEDENVSRITIVAEGNNYTLEQIEKQLNKLIDVIKVRSLASGELLARELVLAKVSCMPAQRNELISIAEITKAKISDVSVNTMTLELSGNENILRTFEELIRPFGIKEMVRTGTIAMQKGATSLK
ncbi:MAG: acetolactate synthase small subunit [Eubacterium sp.]|jgi:acetolactate synthase-1/3 small subunit|nr:acetolactate synthase small subunit [Eubacterium sp.]